jgi:hypothetical protein
LFKPLLVNLRWLCIEIARILNGENNAKIYIYISDELPGPMWLLMGNGENKVIIDIKVE